MHAMRRGQIQPGALHAFLRPPVQDHLGALAVQQRCRCLADPLGGPGDEREFAFELIIHG